MAEFIITIGSNTHADTAVRQAQALLTAALGAVQFSRFIWTAPIGVTSPPYLNGMGHGHTSLTLAALKATLKDIERRCGDTAEDRRSAIVRMDIDLLRYGSRDLHRDDWKRPYVVQLLKELNLQ